jgi:hypothetical protein
MKILLAYYSRSGHTEKLALQLRKELEKQGHDVAVENIASLLAPSKWLLVPPLWSALLVLPLVLWVPELRRWWFKRYPQREFEIGPLRHPDVSAFDLVCVGCPKWLYIAYPLARYLRVVDGLAGKRVGAFATFCGPPLEVFELEMLFAPIAHRLAARGARLGATLAVSSHFHEFFFFREMEALFRLISRLRFRRALRSFTLDSPWGREEVKRFCQSLTLADAATRREEGLPVAE